LGGSVRQRERADLNVAEVERSWFRRVLQRDPGAPYLWYDPAMHWPVWPYTPRQALVMVVSLTLIAAAGAIGLLRTLPSPVGRRLITLLAVPAYPGAVALAASTSVSLAPLAAAEVVYMPTLALACLAVSLVWRSRRRGHVPRTPESPADPAAPADR
jgi:hypothetical protein